jgi:Cutinase
VLYRVRQTRAKAAKCAVAIVSVCVALLVIGLVPGSASAASSGVDMVMSLSDGGSPFVAQKDASTTSTPSGTWTITVRNTGTAASSGTTTIELDAIATGYFLPSAGQGWTCTDIVSTDRVRSCTNDASVPAGGSLPPLTFPWASLPGYGYADATATLTNPSDGTINNNTLSIDTPVVENPAVDLSMSIGDGGSPFVAQQDASTTSTPSGTWTITVRNTGTAASSGTTQVQLNLTSGTGYLQPATGSGWSCDGNTPVQTCTNTAPVPAGGSLPQLQFPAAALPGYGYADATAALTNPSDGSINNTLSIDTPVVQPTSTIDVVASVSDGGVPFTAGSPATYTVTVRNTGTSAASGTTTVYYPAPFAGTVASGAGWTCTASTVSDPSCTYSGGLAANSALPPVTVTGTVPAQDAPAMVRAEVSVDNPSDAFTNDNSTSLDTSVTPLPIDVVATIFDGGFPFTAGQQAEYYVTVRNTGTSAASGLITVHYPAPFPGMVASGTGWTCTASTVTDPTCTHKGGLAARAILPPVTVTGTVPVAYGPGTVRAQVSVDNPSDAFTNDNTAYLDTGITGFPPIKVIHGPACPNVMVIAARGSGDAPSNWTNLSAYTKAANDYGAGKPGYTLYTQLQSARPDLVWSLAPVVYPADSVTLLAKHPSLYLMDAQLGASNIIADIEHTDAYCSHPVRYILAGYSLGAWTVHVAAYELTSTQMSEIAGIALFGDPKFVPSQQIVRDYRQQDTNYGVSALTVDRNVNGVPSALTPMTGSWCFPDDPVCQVLPDPSAWLAELALCAKQLCSHFNYPGTETGKAVTFLSPFLP